MSIETMMQQTVGNLPHTRGAVALEQGTTLSRAQGMTLSTVRGHVCSNDFLTMRTSAVVTKSCSVKPPLAAIAHNPILRPRPAPII